MGTILYLEPEQEQLLNEIAEARGLTVEGYLVTLVEAILCPPAPAPKRGWKTILPRLRKNPQAEVEPRTLADSAARQMRADLLAHKERAVDAVTRMNLLRKATEQQQRTIAEKELQALTYFRDGDEERALRAFQESVVYGQNLQYTAPLLEDATKIAEELLSVFKQEEAKIQARLSRAQSSALSAIESEYAKPRLTEEQMRLHIFAIAGEEQWTALFSEWRQKAEPVLENIVLETTR